MAKFENLIGLKFGKLTVIGRAPNSKQGKARWICRCDCGKIKSNPVLSYDLKSLKISSCGCKYFESNKCRNLIHGLAKTRIYHIWSGMKRRCKVDPNYADINVCKEWENSFDKFYKWAIENGYERNLTLDRIDNSLGYFPDNCRWATYKQQERNRKNNRIVTIKGDSHVLSEWEEITGILAVTIAWRIDHGWNEDELLIKPDLNNKNRRKRNGI